MKKMWEVGDVVARRHTYGRNTETSSLVKCVRVEKDLAVFTYLNGRDDECKFAHPNEKGRGYLLVPATEYVELATDSDVEDVKRKKLCGELWQLFHNSAVSHTSDYTGATSEQIEEFKKALTKFIQQQ